MTKAELKASLDKDGATRNHSAAAWPEAFNQYNAANPSSQLKRGSCGSCYTKVYQWLSR